jgi:AraC-like DNA-binding protein
MRGLYYELRHAVCFGRDVEFTVNVDVPDAAYMPVIQAIVERYGCLSQSEAARLSGMSLSNFSHRFTEVFGKNFRTVRREIRLHLGAILLSTTKMRIADIAYRLGYDSPTTFERSFKRQYGVSPTTYRSLDSRASASTTAGAVCDRAL